MTPEEIAVKLANHENRIKVSEHRIEDLEAEQKVIQELTISVKELALNMKNMLEEQKVQSERIQRLEDEPGKNWKGIKQTTLNTVVSVLAGALAIGLVMLAARYL